jgi:small nuclear ribonucleoprotein (snRNP)-like protein
LFYSFFKTLVGKEVAVELKNDVELTGKLHSVDQYLNVKLEDVQVVKKERYPQLVSEALRQGLRILKCATTLREWRPEVYFFLTPCSDKYLSEMVKRVSLFRCL